jgi:1,4-alpha-glucan branching enzyme
MGYTHVELMSPDHSTCPLPLFSDGASADWMEFVDSMHEAGIGVILDWSPARAAELLLQKRTERGQTVRLACPNTAFEDDALCRELCALVPALVKAYHLDGIFVDVAPLLHHADCPMGHTADPLICPQLARTAEFIRSMDAAFEEQLPDVITVASDRALSEIGVEGTCFSLRRDNGWTEDTISYFEKDPLWRKYEHQKLTLPISYAFSASYLLALPHNCMEEAQGSLLDRMPGEYEKKFANIRLLLAQMMLRPGK